VVVCLHEHEVVEVLHRDEVEVELCLHDEVVVEVLHEVEVDVFVVEQECGFEQEGGPE